MDVVIVDPVGIAKFVVLPAVERRALVVGGYWFIVADSLDEAARIAAKNPCIACGLSMEVRPIELERASAYRQSNETPASRM